MSSNGNGGNGDDDDIDKLVDALRDTNRNLESVSEKLDILVNSMVRGAQEELGTDEDETSVDRWDEGRVSPGTPTTPEAYVSMRANAANSDEIAAPKVTVSGVDRVEFYVEVYRRYGEHMQKVFQSLSAEEWKQFIQQLAVGYGAEPELVDILNPGVELFGIEVLDREANVYSTGTHINYTVFDGNIWFAPEVDFPPIENENPLDALNLVTNEQSEIVFGSLESREVNSEMARAINDRRGLSLPDRFIDLL